MPMFTDDTRLLYELARFHFISEEYTKLTALTEKIPAGTTNDEFLQNIYMAAARACLRTGNKEQFNKYFSLLQDNPHDERRIFFLKAEQAFMNSNMELAAEELQKIDKEWQEDITEMMHLYECRRQMLGGKIIHDDFHYQILLNDSFYSYFQCIAKLYPSLGKTTPETTESVLSELAAAKSNFPDIYLLLAQHYLIEGNAAEAQKNLSYTRSMMGDSAYIDFLELQLRAEALEDFSAIDKAIDEFSLKYRNMAVHFFNSITIALKKNVPETFIFKHLLQDKLNIAPDSTAALEKVAHAQSKAKDYKQKYFLNCVAAGIYLKQGDSENAAREFYNAGIECYNNNSFAEAEKWLRIAYENNPAFVKSGWYLSDSLYINSFTGVFPFTDAEKLQQSLDITDACFKVIQERNEPFTLSWVYLLKAYVHERIGGTQGKDSNEENRKALAFIEMALLCDAKSVTRIKTATRLFSNLGLDINAFAVSEIPAQQNANDSELQEEYVRTLLNKGDFDAADKLLPRLYELYPAGKGVYDGWRAYALYIKSSEDAKLLTDAISFAESKVVNDNHDLWTHFLLLHCYWLNGDFEKASLQADWIIGIENDDNYNAKSAELAFAYFVKGNMEKAIEYNIAAKQIAENMPGSLFDATCYFIAKADLEAAKENFTALAASALKKHEIKNYSRYYTIIAAREKENKTANADAIHQLIYNDADGFIGILEGKLQAVKEDADTIKEIKNFLEKQGYEKQSWGWFALQLSLFRNYVLQKKYEDAITCFANVMNDDRSKQYSLTWSNAADFVAASSGERRDLADAYLQLNNISSGKILQDVIDIFKDGLMDILYDKLKTKNKIAWQLAVSAVALELSNELVPSDVQDYNDTSKWVLFTDHIPEMRSHFMSVYGIDIPGIRVWPFSNFSEDPDGYSYQLRLNDIPMVSGTAYEHFLFCYNDTTESIAAAGIHSADVKAASFLPGGKGVWVSNECRQTLDEKKIPYRNDLLVYIMQHLQYFIENNLPAFFGAQQLEDTLDVWRKDGHEKAIAGLFAEDAVQKKIRLGKILRALLEEKISITNAALILEYCTEDGLKRDDVNDDIRNIRYLLKDNILEKIAADASAVAALPAELEKTAALWLCNDDGKMFMQAEPADVQDWLADFREFVNDNPAVKIILTDNTRARRCIKKMVQLEYPLLEVTESFKPTIMKKIELKTG